MESEIRVAAASEAKLVSEILTEAARWLEQQAMPLWELHEVSPSAVSPEVQAGLYVLAWSGPVVVGTMRLTMSDPVFWPDATPGEALYVHRLAVRRAVAGGQVSSALLRWAAGRAAALGARYLRLDCEVSRPGLRGVYERFGFSFHSEHAVGPFVVARYQFLCTHAA